MTLGAPMTNLIIDQTSRQIALEEEALYAGQTAFWLSLEQATKTGRYADTDAGKGLLNILLPEFLAAYEAWASKVVSTRGPKPSFWPLVQDLDPGMVAYTTAHFILSSMPSKRGEPWTLIKLATVLGRTIEREALLLSYQAQDKKGHKYALQGAAKLPTHLGTRKVVAKALEVVEGWEEWSEEVCVRLGIMLLEVARDLGVVDIVSLGGRDTTYFVHASPRLQDTMSELAQSKELAASRNWPMVAPPLPHAPGQEGGYLTAPARLGNAMVATRSPAHRAALKVPGAISEEVYEALNAIQGTPWRINRFVLDVLNRAEVKGISLPHQGACPNIPTGEAISPKEKALAHQARGQWVSKQRQTTGTLWQARRFAGEESIWFPHFMDYRGRLYPMPGPLSPQGDDLAQGLLEFSVGKVAGDVGVDWLKVNFANLCGFDKAVFADRILWVDMRWDMVAAIATDPLGAGLEFWTAPGVSAYQALAAAHDLYHTVTTSGWKSHTAVKLDGSCNGLQHLSAIGLDRDMGMAVNMCALEERKDVYGEVADNLRTRVARILNDPNSTLEDRGWAQAWLDFGITRTITKKSTMTLPYGATYFGQADQLMVGVKDQAAKQGKALSDVLGGNAFKACSWMRDHIWAAMNETLPAGVATMEWIQGAAKAAAQKSLPLTWETPDGFLVVQDRRVVKARRIQLGSATRRMQISVGEYTDQVDGRKQASSAAPNFVHSLDAAALRVHVRTMEAHGVHNHALIHDSFGTHAADVELMNRSIRDSFIAVYETRPIGVLEAYLVESGVEYQGYQEVGTYDLEELRAAPYFFA